jgi:hypothetical protein
MTELRGNWEPERDILGHWTQPAERTCTLCRRDLHHTKAEHDLLYPADRAAQIAHDRAETERQVAVDNQILHRLIAGGMSEEQAEDELWRMMCSGEGLVEPRPRP